MQRSIALRRSKNSSAFTASHSPSAEEEKNNEIMSGWLWPVIVHGCSLSILRFQLYSGLLISDRNMPDLIVNLSPVWARMIVFTFRDSGVVRSHVPAVRWVAGLRKYCPPSSLLSFWYHSSSSVVCALRSCRALHRASKSWAMMSPGSSSRPYLSPTKTYNAQYNRRWQQRQLQGNSVSESRPDYGTRLLFIIVWVVI